MEKEKEKEKPTQPYCKLFKSIKQYYKWYLLLARPMVIL